MDSDLQNLSSLRVHEIEWESKTDIQELQLHQGGGHLHIEGSLKGLWGNEHIHGNLCIFLWIFDEYI